jgi:glycosyltransferase involved in cell wall biosynthesis
VTAPATLAAPELLPPDLVGALRQRLGAAAGVLDVHVEDDGQDEAGATALLFTALVDRAHGDHGSESLWLLLTALNAALPDADEVRAALRARDLHGPGDFGAWLLSAGFEVARNRGSLRSKMDVVVDAVVVDVDFSARHKLHTGIQRVVRETVPRWHRDHELELVAWTEQGGSMRRLRPEESDRVLRWHEITEHEDDDDGTDVRPHRLLVPWRSRLVMPEVPAPEHCPLVAALATFSGSEVALIGHDCIPVISPEIIHPGLPDRYTRYLETVKHAHRVMAVSESAGREFRGFADMLVAQGLTGPSVVVCPNAGEIPPGLPSPAPRDRPLVVSIGSFEPRKNQLAVLHAAEHLWREGLHFELCFIGGGGWVTEADSFLARLRAAGRPIEQRTAISDTELWATLRAARFSTFVSLHEGFGLPVAESLACGTPCLTTGHGSTREVGAGGGAVFVDPMDDLAIADQMRRLLTDDELVARLRDEAHRRPSRTWDDYARESWAALVPPAGDRS